MEARAICKDENEITNDDIVTIEAKITRLNMDEDSVVPFVTSNTFSYIKKERYHLFLVINNRSICLRHEYFEQDKKEKKIEFLLPPGLLPVG